MSGFARNRRGWRLVVLRALPLVALFALTATLTLAVQVRQVHVYGTHKFAAREVEIVLQNALGTPTVAARADALRATIMQTPWVADAVIRVSLDGIVTCSITERVPVAEALDLGRRHLVDIDGRLLQPTNGSSGLLILEGFGANPDERAQVLTSADLLAKSWGNKLERIERLGPHDVVLHFAGLTTPVLADPARPGMVKAARQVFNSWMAQQKSMPARIDARVQGRVAVLPAPPPIETIEEAP